MCGVTASSAGVGVWSQQAGSWEARMYLNGGRENSIYAGDTDAVTWMRTCGNLSSSPRLNFEDGWWRAGETGSRWHGAQTLRRWISVGEMGEFGGGVTTLTRWAHRVGGHEASSSSSLVPCTNFPNVKMMWLWLHFCHPNLTLNVSCGW